MALLAEWELIEADLQEAGVDVGDDTLMSARSGRWLKTRIEGLFTADTRVSRHFHQPKEVA